MSHPVLIVGGGGREHALAWKLAQSPQVKHIIVAPGNGGTIWDATDKRASCESVAIGVTDFDALIDLAQVRNVSLTVVGPEVPLADGIVDAFEAAGLRIFGPAQASAQLEASKAFSRAFMTEVRIPSPEYGTFSRQDDALEFVREFNAPVVVKASGLAAGKGVLICESVAEAEQAIKSIMEENAFGSAGDEIVVEERLIGDEFSVLAFCDGQVAVPMMIARDYKRALDGDEGLNTGGMGAFAPTPDISAEEIEYITRCILQPTVDAMSRKGTPYKGVLYAGLMRSGTDIKVLEFNCRFGDPETQVVLPMLDSDLFAIMNACIDGTLAGVDIRWKDGACATVVLASPGYPDRYPRGLPITVGETASDTIIFHAGTTVIGDQLVTSGGRVMAVTAQADTLETALERIYSEIGETVYFEGMHFRHDIGRQKA